MDVVGYADNKKMPPRFFLSGIFLLVISVVVYIMSASPTITIIHHSLIHSSFQQSAYSLPNDSDPNDFGEALDVCGRVLLDVTGHIENGVGVILL